MPPHDTTIEAHLLGAALIAEQAAQVVAGLDPTTFYKPAHSHVAATIGDLHARGWPTDVGTVGAHLHQQGLLDDIGGYPYLTQLMADTPATRSAEHWATLIEEYSAKRRLLALSAETVEAVYRGIPAHGLIEAMHQTALEVDQAVISSWEQVNLARILAGEQPDQPPTILARSDGVCLIYPAKVHVVNSEPETGKSWLALHACIGEMGHGHHVVYVDFEDSAGEIVNRLLHLGATPEQILDLFHYVRPDDQLNAAATARLVTLAETHQASLCVIDGVTEAMSLAGLSIKDNDDIARFYALLPRPIVRAGAAVLLLDHLVKDKENQGRWGIGGQHKLAGVDGVVYKFERVTPFAPGHGGSSRLSVSKDRAGQVRQHASGAAQVAGIVRYNPLPGGALDVVIDADDTDSGDAWDGPTHCEEAVLELLAGMPGEKYGVNRIMEMLRARGNSYRKMTVSVAAEILVSKGLLAVAAGPRNSQQYSYQMTSGEVNDDPTD